MNEGNPRRDPTCGSSEWNAGPFRWELDHRALVMAILNVTPDSFSDGGRHFAPADTLTARVIPMIKQLAATLKVALSIDTCKPLVAQAALEAGAHIVNDISGFRDPAMIEVCAASDCGLVVMHMQGTPETMQRAPRYSDVVDEVRAFFEERLITLTTAGIEASRIVFDPGIGFGKTLEHNLALLNGVGDYQVGQRPILMGLSRKSLIGALLDDPSIERREAPTQALTALTRRNGAMIHRVHAVRENAQVLRMLEATL